MKARKYAAGRYELETEDGRFIYVRLNSQEARMMFKLYQHLGVRGIGYLDPRWYLEPGKMAQGRLESRNRRDTNYFTVWSVSREIIAENQRDEDGREPAWPYKLSDDQMERIASRMTEGLEDFSNILHDLVRDAVNEVVDEDERKVR